MATRATAHALPRGCPPRAAPARASGSGREDRRSCRSSEPSRMACSRVKPSLADEGGRHQAPGIGQTWAVPPESQAPDRPDLARPPLCFVVMPFGTKPDGQGGSVDFDAVYEQLLRPAIVEAELEPLRADEEVVGGLIHKPMFERLILADYAVVDLTTANANVFYELGVRHAVRPYSTVLVGADVRRAPFDVAPTRIRPYRLDGSGRPAEPDADRAALTAALRDARAASTDSPVFQLVDELPRPQIDRLKTDLFRQQAEYSADVKARLAQAR